MHGRDKSMAKKLKVEVIREDDQICGLHTQPMALATLHYLGVPPELIWVCTACLEADRARG